MRHMIIILSLLFVSFGVLTTGKENCCVPTGTVCIAINCEQAPVVEIKINDAISAASVEDSYQPLSPVSHFILL